MKLFRFVLSAAVCLPLAMLQLGGEPAAAEMPQTAKEKRSYLFGANLGRGLRQGEIKKEDLDLDMVVQGLVDMLEGRDSQVSDEEARKVFTEFQKVLAARRKAKADAETAKGEAFLAENKKQEGWKATDSGLQYKVVEAGKGATPKPTDKVKVHYEGRLIDGTVFDSSKDGDPAVFPVNRVIPGWTEALTMMKVGGKWQIVLPPKLAYGERGSPPRIGPNAVLVFDVELLDVVE